MVFPDDSFLVGANLPWMLYGCDFGANAWRPRGGLAQPPQRDRTRAVLGRLAEAGARAVRWFVLADGRAGLRVDAAGRLLGLDAWFRPDLDTAVALLGDSGLRAIFVLLDFTWFSPPVTVQRVQTGGRTRLVGTRAGRARLIDTVIAPILDRYGREPAILAWEVVNEPEWVVTRRPVWRGHRVSRRAMRAFIRGVARQVRRRTRQMVTVGSACASSLPLVAGLGLDFYQVHWYDHLPGRFHPRERVHPPGGVRRLLLGEFPTRGSADSPHSILRAAHGSGYAGAFAWSVMRRDEASDREALERAIAAWSACRLSPPGNN